MKEKIPNLITLMNLFFGCVAIMFATQSYLQPMYDGAGYPMLDGRGIQYINVPEQIWYASLCIGLAAVVDFFDGFVARWLKVESELGKQLDSLADVVSFGVAPAIIVFQFLKLSFSQLTDGLNISIIFLLPAFIIPCAAAYRLGKFNLNKTPSNYFKGLPVPSVGIFIAALPLAFWENSNSFFLKQMLVSYWFWYAVIIILSWLMLSKISLLSLKIKSFKLPTLLPLLIILVLGILSLILLGWIGISITILIYIFVSLIFIKKEKH